MKIRKKSMNILKVMNTNVEFTPMMIKCPDCHTIQAGILEYTIPFVTCIHYCIKCKYTIMESEWDIVEPYYGCALSSH